MITNAVLDISITADLTIEPVTVSEAKSYLHIDFSSDDIFIETLIRSSRKRLEKYTGLSFGTKTIVSYLALNERMELPYGPVQSVTTVRQYAGFNDYSTITDYDLIGTDFKMFCANLKGEFEVTYEAGYLELPEDLKLAILAEVAYRYENRGDEVMALSNTAKDLAHPYKRLSYTI